MAIPIGRQGRVYAKKESSYGVDPTLAVTNAFRHIDIGFAWDPKMRVTSPEKKTSPGAVNRFDRKQEASWDLRTALVRPSGTLNTLGEGDPFFEAGFGSVTNVTLSTTVSASPAPTINTFTVPWVGSLVVGDAVLINMASEPAGKRDFVRVISAINALELVVEPDLPAAPAMGDTVKGCITYKLSTALAVAMHIAHFNTTGQDRAVRGAGVDRMRFVFDENDEPTFSASGPAKDQVVTGDTGMPSDPSTVAQVGNNPPSGLVGQCTIGNTIYLMRHMEAEIANNVVVRNNEYGELSPTELYRRGRREVSVTVSAWAEPAATLYALATAGTDVSVMLQTGFTEGNIIGLFIPAVEFKVPAQDDGDEEIGWDFDGVALESADGQNDEITLVFA